MQSTVDAITDLLFVEMDPTPADAILALCSEFFHPQRVIELLQTEIAPLAIISGGKKIADQTEAVVVGALVAHHAVLTKLVLEDKSANTLENIVFSKAILSGLVDLQSIKHIILVTIPLHSRRALMTAKKQFPPHLTVSCCPTQDRRGINRDNWWLNNESRTLIMQEVASIGTYYLKGDIGDF